MVILRTRNKITDFLMILAWASPFNTFDAMLSFLNCHLLKHVKVCLATATHTFKWLKIADICFICDQTFANFDV